MSGSFDVGVRAVSVSDPWIRSAVSHMAAFDWRTDLRGLVEAIGEAPAEEDAFRVTAGPPSAPGWVGADRVDGRVEDLLVILEVGGDDEEPPEGPRLQAALRRASAVVTEVLGESTGFTVHGVWWRLPHGVLTLYAGWRDPQFGAEVALFAQRGDTPDVWFLG